MKWNEIAGQENLKKLLKDSISENRVSHAQLFVGKEGYGTLPLVLACAQEIFSKESNFAAQKVEKFNHVDLHFSFPVFKEKNAGLSNRFFDDFRTMILENPYANLEDWNAILESENKQLTIYADEIDDLNQKFSLKSFEGGSKILIVWRADKMNDSAANKFLKFLEEPPQKTLIFLVAESLHDFLPTIISRTQIVEVPRIEDEELKKYLNEHYEISSEKLNEIVHQAQGDLNVAMKLLSNENEVSEFDELFCAMGERCFPSKKKTGIFEKYYFLGKKYCHLESRKTKKLFRLLFRNVSFGDASKLFV